MRQALLCYAWRRRARRVCPSRYLSLSLYIYIYIYIMHIYIYILCIYIYIYIYTHTPTHVYSIERDGYSYRDKYTYRDNVIFRDNSGPAPGAVVAGAGQRGLGWGWVRRLVRVRDRGGAPKRGRHSTIFVPPHASVQWQPDGSTIHTKKWFLGAGFLGAPPISLRGWSIGP